MVLFGTNLVSNVSTKASKKALVLELDYHYSNANKVFEHMVRGSGSELGDRS